MLDDIGLDSMMAMDFRVEDQYDVLDRYSGAGDPQGVSVNSLTGRVLAELRSTHGDASDGTEEPAPPQAPVVDADVERLMDELSDAELRELLAELETQTIEPNRRGALVTGPPHDTCAGLSKAYGQCRRCKIWISTSATARSSRSSVPNGAGKSTTIEILEGNRKRDSGQVRVLGEDPATAGRNWRAKIGIVLQEASDAGMLTVRETVQMFTSCYGTARTPEDVLDLVGLASTSGSRVRNLSGGQRRRLDVALGIVGHAGTAVPGRTDHRFRSRGQTPILGSHQAFGGRRHDHRAHHALLEEAAALADRVAVIAGGRMVAVDSPRG